MEAKDKTHPGSALKVFTLNGPVTVERSMTVEGYIARGIIPKSLDMDSIEFGIQETLVIRFCSSFVFLR
jgi:hypothetical protein